MNFFHAVETLGLFLLWGAAGIAGLLFLAYVVLRLAQASIRAMQNQILGTAEAFAGSNYETTDGLPSLRQWRKELKAYEGWLGPLGYSKFVSFVNTTSAQAGKANYHINFKGPDGATLFCITFLTLQRPMPFFGYHLPYPSITGIRHLGWSMETRLSSGTLLITMKDASGSRYPSNYEMQDTAGVEVVADVVHRHNSGIAKHLDLGSSVVPWENEEQYMDFHSEQHEILSQFMREDFEKLAEKLGSCGEDDADPAD